MAAPVILENYIKKNERKILWVFGYGSLIWKPGFKFEKVVLGSAKGFRRLFWQGNITHRGTKEQPGRVATLMEDEEGVVHGVAFAISEEAAISYLSKRECDQGGYISKLIDFHPLKGGPIKVLVYVATSSNPLWLGEAHLDEIASQIINCQGNSGHNVEYLIRLADFMRRHFPYQRDNHLFELEAKVLKMISINRLCLKTMMGNGEGCITFRMEQQSSPDQNSGNENDLFQQSTKMAGRKLHCVNI